MTNTIIDFWKKNNQFWIPVNDKQKYLADQTIYNHFFNYDITNENIFGKIIFLDQFSRHFSRYNNSISEEMVIQNRLIAYKIVIDNIEIIQQDSDEIEILFSCMVLKHTGYLELALEICEKWLNGRSLILFTNLLHFYEDTYKKCYIKTKVWDKIIVSNYDPLINVYNSEKICDYYPIEYIYNNYYDICVSKFKEIEERILQLLPNKYNDKKIIVSLSGGVDSMVMLMLLKLLGLKDVEAVHINYGNRDVAMDECNFIINYCKKLNVKLFIYNIEKIRRKNVSREFYETMTRFLRFSVYEYFGQAVIYLGHIIDDIIENIWTNIANCKHIDNLKKMSIYDTQMGVLIKRPFLDIEKKDIYKISKLLKVPYLKNTTPSWSNRGKFRDSFYKSTHLQFGNCVDNKIIEFADIIEKQCKIIELILYKPIIDSYNDILREIDITLAIESNLDFLGWNIIFERLCHYKLSISKPSKSSINQFISRIQFMNCKNLLKIKVVMKSDLMIMVIKDNKYTLKIL